MDEKESRQAKIDRFLGKETTSRPYLDKRIDLGFAKGQAEEIVHIVRPYVKKLKIAGSIRRGEEDCGDVDIVVIPKESLEDVNQALEKWDRFWKFTERGMRRCIFYLENGVEGNIWAASEKTWGAILTWATGSSTTNIEIAHFCKENGFRWGQSGLKKRDTGEIVETKTEKEFFRKIGKKWIPVEER